MAEQNELIEAITNATNWDARVTLIRRIPELYGTAEHAAVYAAVARQVYLPKLTPEFAHVHWRDEYELEPLKAAYAIATESTGGFAEVSRDHLQNLIGEKPTTLRVFRLLLGLTAAEFAEACSIVADRHGLSPVSKTAVRNAEDQGRIQATAATTCATAIDLAMRSELFPAKSGRAVRSKIEKPDTAKGWDTVREYAAKGVPLAVFLHQRLYGGAFRQLLDATSSSRGDLLEDPVQELFVEFRIPHVRTGAHNQQIVETRFGVTVRPAPDFVIYDNRTGALRAILECKGANDGGTARDKASRFRSLRSESQRLGGVPVFAVLGGIGWRRTADALGPVVRDTDGRVFTLATINEMLETDPFPTLKGLADDDEFAATSNMEPR